ncbi:hypothetical protein CDD83_4341 [Cordyceps sp. RAO-2017]|nr:hypothetical protein CDD83_4341 [Cordyceps sp. RAO-2017]
MEQVHGVDVSWMTRGSPRDKFSRSSSSHASPPRTPQPRSLPPPVPSARNPEGTADVSAAASAAANGQSNGTPGAGHPNGHPNGQPDGPPSPASSTPKRLSRSGSADRLQGPNGSAPQRRNSWFSNISAKFSGSSSSPQNNAAASHHSNHHLHLKDQQHPSAQNQEPQSPLQSPSSQPQSPNSPSDPLPPKLHAARNAVLQHAARPDGNGPYTPAPPKSGQAGILGVFRRLSSSGTAGLAGGKMGNGLVERITLNVDQNRKRCPIPELKDAKLRRVSFCVDVEIAPMPKS